MFVALGIFLAASLLCAAATSVEMLSLARVLQGLGGGGLMTLSQALIGETIPPRERARYQGYLAAVMVTPPPSGRWSAAISPSTSAGAACSWSTCRWRHRRACSPLRLPSRPARGEPWSFDSIGLILFVGFIVPVLLALEQVQRLNATALAAFVAADGRRPRRHSSLWCGASGARPIPLLPISLLRQPTIWRSDALAACHGATLVSLIAFLPIYLRVVRGTSASETGLLLLPLMFGIGFGSMLTGRIVSRTGLTAIFPSIGLIFATASLLAFALLADRLGNWWSRRGALLQRPLHGHRDGRRAGDGAERGGPGSRSAPPPPRCSCRARSAPRSARR